MHLPFTDPAQRPKAVSNCRLLITVIVPVLLSLASSLGQAAEVNANQNQLPIRLGLYLEQLIDSDGAMTVEQVRAAGPEDWVRSTQAVPTLGFSDAAYWFRFTLSGDAVQVPDLAIALDSATLDRVDFFAYAGNQQLARATAGDTIPYSQLDVPISIPLFKLGSLATANASGAGGTVSLASLDIYLRVESQSGLELPLELTTLSGEMQRLQTNSMFDGVLFGFFFIGFAICFVLFTIIKDRQFIGYILFFGAVSLFMLSMTGMGRNMFWSESVDLNTRLAYFSGILILASFCLLGQSVNLEHKYRDHVALVLRFIAWIMLPVAGYFLVSPLEQINMVNIQIVMFLGIVVAFLVFTMTGFAAAQGSRLAMYSFSSWSLIIMAFLTLLAYKTAIFERSETIAVIGQSFLMLSAIMLLVALAEFVRIKNEEFSQARLETKAKGDFLKNVSREFLTPVHLILSNSKRLMAAHARRLDETTQEHMNTVIKQSDHLHSLINDLLEMSEIESDSFEPEFELVEMSQFLNELRDTMLPSILEKGLECKTEFASANLLVQTDRARLQHALINIVTNAIKFTDEGSITVGYQAVYFKRRLGIELFVRDTGRGVSDEFKQRLFEEFSRDEDYSEKEPSNTGLGMVIVKRLIEKLGGEVDFESRQGSGSTFLIRLPLRIGKN